MTSKFTARFRRRKDGEVSAPDTPSVAPALAEATPEAVGKTETEAKLEAKPDVVEMVAPDASKVETGKVEADDKAAKPTVAPARLVEMEKPKAARPEFAQAKAWLSNAHAYRVPAAAAAAVVAALLTGYGFGAAGQARYETGSAKSVALLETTTKDLREAHGQIGQLAAELKSVKTAVEGMKGEREKSRGDILTKQAQLSERLERTGQENATRIGRLAEQLDRIEKAQRDAVRKADAEKSDKTEKSDKVAAAVPKPPAKPHLDVPHTGSLGEAKAAEAPKPDPRKTPLDGYVVRDYDDGYALIETRSGRYIDVAVGYTLPGVGKVEAIERRGRQWVVVTAKGFIGER